MTYYCIIHSIKHSRIFCDKCYLYFCAEFKDEHNLMCNNNKFRTHFYVSKLTASWDGKTLEDRQAIMKERRIKYKALDSQSLF